MSKYLFVETRDPFESSDVQDTWDLAVQLAAKGNQVTMVLIQNGVLAARAGANVNTLGDPRVAVLADDLSLTERGIPAGELRDGVKVTGIDGLTDLVMEDDRKPIWT